MAVTKGPLFSLDASGTVGGAIVFSKWKGRNYVRRHAVPANPKSGGQLGVRAMMKFLTQYWSTLTGTEQATWETRAETTNISPFNAYTSYDMARFGTYLMPSKEDPAVQSDLAGVLANEAATAQSRAILIDLDVSVVNQNWGVIIHRGLLTGFTPSRANAVQVIPAESAASFQWLDFPLTVGVAQFYRFTPFSIEGVIGVNAVEVTATPTA